MTSKNDAVRVSDVVAPTTASDVYAGFSPGAQWTDTVASKHYICLSAAAGAAVWLEVGGSSASGIFTGVAVNGAAATYRSLKFQSAGVDRFALEITSEAESGSDVGSNLVINTKSDAGAQLKQVIKINRRYGFVEFVDGCDLNFGTTSGTKFGANATQKIGFFGKSPVVQPTALTTADASTVDTTYGTEEAAVIANLRTRLGELETKLKALGLLA